MLEFFLPFYYLPVLIKSCFLPKSQDGHLNVDLTLMAKLLHSYDKFDYP